MAHRLLSKRQQFNWIAVINERVRGEEARPETTINKYTDDQSNQTASWDR